jgi:hypothetical protein
MSVDKSGLVLLLPNKEQIYRLVVAGGKITFGGKITERGGKIAPAKIN